MGQKVAIIFYSATGNTEAMAEAVAVGAKKAGADVLLAPVSDVDPVEIGNTCHRIILGCSAWGVEVIEEAQMKPFCDKLKPYLKGKIMGIFGSCGWSRGAWLNSCTMSCTLPEPDFQRIRSLRMATRMRQHSKIAKSSEKQWQRQKMNDC